MARSAKNSIPKLEPLSHKSIAAAALGCFERYGPERTSMADIALAAGTSRQSVYRFFEDRSKLIEYILDRRIAELAEQVRKGFSEFETIQDALVEGSLLSIRVAQQDELYMSIVRASTDHSLEIFMLRSTEAIRQSMMVYWGPTLDKARAKGDLRPDLDNDRILEWIRSVHTVLMMRDDQTEDWKRQFLIDFFVPSLMK